MFIFISTFREENNSSIGTVDDLESSLGHLIPGRVNDDNMWEDCNTSDSEEQISKMEEDCSESELDFTDASGKVRKDTSEIDDPDWCDMPG